MSVKPILFNTEMVRAILDGRKSCTRRLIKSNVDAVLNSPYYMKHPEVKDAWLIRRLCKAPYEPGDILYVRETWHKYTKRVGEGESCHLAEFYGYKASIANSEDANEPWRSPINMPKEAARIWLKVAYVRVERLQEITEDGAKAEGANWKNGKNVGFEEKMRRTAIERFAESWNGAIKKSDIDYYGWDANPWVWVIELERCDKPEGV